MSLANWLQCQLCLSKEDRTMPMYSLALSMSKDKLIGKFLHLAWWQACEDQTPASEETLEETLGRPEAVQRPATEQLRCSLLTGGCVTVIQLLLILLPMPTFTARTLPTITASWAAQTPTSHHPTTATGATTGARQLLLLSRPLPTTPDSIFSNIGYTSLVVSKIVCKIWNSRNILI
jgi:hypothetical protein